MRNQPPTDTRALAQAIEEFEHKMPGWWWSVGHCELTRDASCGPDFRVLGMGHPFITEFDSGFHWDGEGTLADSLMNVMAQAVAAVASLEETAQ